MKVVGQPAADTAVDAPRTSPAVKPSPPLHGYSALVLPLKPTGGSLLRGQGEAPVRTWQRRGHQKRNTTVDADCHCKTSHRSQPRRYLVPKLPTLCMPTSMYLPFRNTSPLLSEELRGRRGQGDNHNSRFFGSGFKIQHTHAGTHTSSAASTPHVHNVVNQLR